MYFVVISELASLSVVLVKLIKVRSNIKSLSRVVAVLKFLLQPDKGLVRFKLVRGNCKVFSVDPTWVFQIQVTVPVIFIIFISNLSFNKINFSLDEKEKFFLNFLIYTRIPSQKQKILVADRGPKYLLNPELNDP